MGSFHFVLNGDISVGTMKTQSGVFISEYNQSIGWSSHSKSNGIFSDISGNLNTLSHNLFIVHDPDLIDTPIDDRDVHLVHEQTGRDQTANLFLDDINVGTMYQNSSVFLGKGTISGMDGNTKGNHSIGGIYGNMNKDYNNLNLNYDTDLIDGIIYDQDIKIIKSGAENDGRR